MPQSREFVWMPDERVYAEILSLGAYASQIKYTKDGIDYNVTISNEDFEYFGEYGIDYDTD